MYKIIKAMITLLALSIIIPIKLLGLIIKAITRAIKQAEKNAKYSYRGCATYTTTTEKEEKGLQGEYKTIDYIRYVTDDDNILHDVNISDAQGHTAQIDVVVLDYTGIYVVEVKNFANNAKVYLTNSKDVKLYYKIKYQPSQEEAMYNPVWQNRTHINHLSSYLNLSTSFFVNIVSIAGGEYVDYISDHSNVTVTYAYNIVNVLQSKMNRRRNVLNETDIISIRRALKPEMQAEIEHKAELQRQREIEQEERQAKAAAIKQKISAYIKKQATAIKNMFNNDHEKSD